MTPNHRHATTGTRTYLYIDIHEQLLLGDQGRFQKPIDGWFFRDSCFQFANPVELDSHSVFPK